MPEEKINRRKPTREDKKLAKRIRQLREERGMTQYDPSLLLSKNIKYVSYIETNRRSVSLPMVYKIAKSLKVEVMELFNWK